jgi:hypothetical protein
MSGYVLLSARNSGEAHAIAMSQFPSGSTIKVLDEFSVVIRCPLETARGGFKQVSICWNGVEDGLSLAELLTPTLWNSLK